MPNILTVFGATGNQGRSLIRHVLADPHLSTHFSIRAIARDPTSPAALSLQTLGGAVELVQGDLNDRASIAAALRGTHTVFLVTVSNWFDPTGLREVEFAQGKAVADAAVATPGCEYLIFSSCVDVAGGSGGAITGAVHLDVKAEVEAYIRGLGIKSAFFHPGTFMQNFGDAMAPRPLDGDGDDAGTYGLFSFVQPDTKFPLIDVEADTGKFVGAILADPDAFEGKVLSAATYLRSHAEVAEMMTRATGKTVKYVQIPRETMEGFMPTPTMAKGLCDMFLWMQDFGYYGEGTAEKVEWTAGRARGTLTSLEEYFGREPLKI